MGAFGSSFLYGYNLSVVNAPSPVSAYGHGRAGQGAPGAGWGRVVQTSVGRVLCQTLAGPWGRPGEGRGREDTRPRLGRGGGKYSRGEDGGT